VITLVRNVTTNQFLDALNEELVPKLKAAGADVGIMESLGALFKARPLTKDSAVVISWKLPATLQASPSLAPAFCMHLRRRNVILPGVCECVAGALCGWQAEPFPPLAPLTPCRSRSWMT